MKRNNIEESIEAAELRGYILGLRAASWECGKKSLEIGIMRSMKATNQADALRDMTKHLNDLAEQAKSEE